MALGGATGPTFGSRNFDSILNFGARPNSARIPVNEFNDSLSWARGKHTFTFGGLVRFLKIEREDASASFPSLTINLGTCPNLCADAFANVTGDSR